MHQLPEPKDYGRLPGVIMLLVGLAICGWLTYLYRFGGSVLDIFIFLGPVLVVMGIADLIRPGLMKTMERGNKPHPVAIMVMIVACLVGLGVRIVFFGDWSKH